MKEFLKKLIERESLIGRFTVENEFSRLPWSINKIHFFPIEVSDLESYLEIDGKNMEPVTDNCFKVELDVMEIYLTPSGPHKGEFTAGLKGVSLLDEPTVNYMLRLMLGLSK